MEPCTVAGSWADLLSKFQGAPPWIQALWLVLVTVVALGVVWCVTDVLKHALAAFRQREPRGRLVYGLVQDEDGRWLVYADGTVRAVEAGEVFDGPQAALLDASGPDRLLAPILPRRL